MCVWVFLFFSFFWKNVGKGGWGVTPAFPEHLQQVHVSMHAHLLFVCCVCPCVWCWITHPPSLSAWWCVGRTPARAPCAGRPPAPVLLPRQTRRHQRRSPSPSAPAPRTASWPAACTHTHTQTDTHRETQEESVKTTYLPTTHIYTPLSIPQSGLNNYRSKNI